MQPFTVDVLIETPQGSRSKYEYDGKRHALRLDRRLFSATVFPVDYGFIPETVGADGEDLDALVLTDTPTFPGCWVTARVLGVLWISYGKDREAKIICVPDGDPTWQDVTDMDDVPGHLREEIAHFLKVYKQLEPGQTPETAEWADADSAIQVINAARKDSQQNL